MYLSEMEGNLTSYKLHAGNGSWYYLKLQNQEPAALMYLDVCHKYRRNS